VKLLNQNGPGNLNWKVGLDFTVYSAQLRCGRREIMNKSKSGNVLEQPVDDSLTDVSGAAERHTYDVLGPDQVLDAVEGLGLPTSARVFALNSYENRVYQIGLDDGSFVIAKFYRPERWSDAQILE
jgi:hypothetical protein